MKVYIFGNKGNMGRRYAAILRELGHESYGCDPSAPECSQPLGSFDDYDAYIVATPTSTHLEILSDLLDCNKPVLCEKPFVKNAGIELTLLLKYAEERKMQLSMVSQYDYCILNKEETGLTSYDYYHSGPDGIAWDCINLIWHASGPIELKNESPIWKCQINGESLTLDLVADSYLTMINEWLNRPYEPQYERILKAHQKVEEFIARG